MYMREQERLIHFDRLKERLLAAGIAPRHVRRTLSELRDHYDDAVRDEQQRGNDAASAEQNAWARLGDEDAIAASVIARPELRSLPARYPRLIFGAGPVLLWALAAVGIFLKLALIVTVLKAVGVLPLHGGRDPQWFQHTAPIACFVYTRLLPLLIGLAAVVMAMRQRCATHAPMIGALIIAIFAGFSDISVTFPEGDRPGMLFISNWLLASLMPFTDELGPADATQFMSGMTVAAFNALVILTPYVLWRRRYIARAA